MKRGARYIAIEVLCQWRQSGNSVDRIVDEHLRQFPDADPRDRHLVKALVYGVIRWQGYLDGILANVSTHPLRKMKPRTLQGLRIGLFQLLFMDRMHAGAVINETVQALKSGGQPKWLAGFVNGVLRNIARKLDEPGSPLAALPADAALKSHPKWLVDRWQARYGQEQLETICRLNNTQPNLALRVNIGTIPVDEYLETLRQKDIAAEKGKFAPDAVRLPEYRGAIDAIPGYAEGHFQVQDEAAQLVTLLAGPFHKGVYLDGCAGLGGKTSHLAALLPTGSRLVAVEPDTMRAGRLTENLSRLRLVSNVNVVQARLEQYVVDSQERFDRILIDAPCSGLGVIRRHPDIRWNRKPKDLPGFQEQQLALLTAAATALVPGGVLVYVTCSTEPEENDAVIEKFLAAHPGFSISEGRDFLPPAAAAFVDKKGFFRTIPNEDGLDGFFGARLVKS